MIDQSSVKNTSVNIRLTEWERQKLQILQEGKTASYTIRQMIRSKLLEAI